MIETEKLLKYYISEYCSLIINHKTSLHSIFDEKGVKPCLRKAFSFKFKKVESTVESSSNLLYLGRDESINYFEFKYDYMEAKDCSAPIRDPYNCTLLIHNKDGTIVDFAIIKGTWTYNFFKNIQKKLEKIEYLPHHYITENPLVSYCIVKQHELMGGNYSSLAVTKENFEKFASEFCALINDSNALKSLTRTETFKKTAIKYTYREPCGVVPMSKNILISEDFIIKPDDITYPFILSYICESENSNVSYVELYPYNFDGSSLKFIVNNTDNNFSLFMNIRDSLRKMSEKGEYYLSDQIREPIRKNCDKFNENLRNVLDRESKGLNMTSTNNLNATMNHIIATNRTNGIVPNLNTIDLATNNSQVVFPLSNNVTTNPIAITNSTEIQTSTWLTPLITAGGVISLVVIGIFKMFKCKQNRYQNQNTKEHIPSSEKRNSERKHSFIQPENYPLHKSRSSTSLKSRRYNLSSPESIEKLNTEQELPNCIIVDPDQESCAFITHPSSGV